jgi:putative glutamine transport system ATP-binding protein
MGHDPEILLLDEPTSALDPEMSAEVTDALETLSQEGKTLVLATHATGFARRIGGQVAFLHDHRLTWSGPTKDFFQNPPNEGARLYLSRIYRE